MPHLHHLPSLTQLYNWALWCSVMVSRVRRFAQCQTEEEGWWQTEPKWLRHHSLGLNKKTLFVSSIPKVYRKILHRVSFLAPWALLIKCKRLKTAISDEILCGECVAGSQRSFTDQFTVDFRNGPICRVHLQCFRAIENTFGEVHGRRTPLSVCWPVFCF